MSLERDHRRDGLTNPDPFPPGVNTFNMLSPPHPIERRWELVDEGVRGQWLLECRRFMPHREAAKRVRGMGMAIVNGRAGEPAHPGVEPTLLS